MLFAILAAATFSCLRYAYLIILYDADAAAAFFVFRFCCTLIFRYLPYASAFATYAPAAIRLMILRMLLMPPWLSLLLLLVLLMLTTSLTPCHTPFSLTPLMLIFFRLLRLRRCLLRH